MPDILLSHPSTAITRITSTSPDGATMLAALPFEPSRHRCRVSYVFTFLIRISGDPSHTVSSSREPGIRSQVAACEIDTAFCVIVG